MRRVGGDATILAAEFTVGFSRGESGPGEMGGWVGGEGGRLANRTREDGEKGGKNRGKLEKTAEGVNNSCRQYDFFM